MTLRTDRILIGISACLTGERVRYDGDHRYDVDLISAFSGIAELVPVCPEVAIGMGVPREPIYLVGDRAAPRAVGSATPNLDVTHALTDYGRHMAQALRNISGYIFKARSPSCGIGSVNLYPFAHAPHPIPQGTGIYAQALTAILSRLPIAEDEPLKNLAFRNQFMAQVYAYHHQQNDR